MKNNCQLSEKNENKAKCVYVKKGVGIRILNQSHLNLLYFNPICYVIIILSITFTIVDQVEE